MSVDSGNGCQDRRSVLKSLSSAALGVGGLVAAGSGTGAASHDVQACPDSGDSINVYWNCDDFPSHKDTVTQYHCGWKQKECTTDSGRVMWYVEWEYDTDENGWVFRDQMCGCCCV